MNTKPKLMMMGALALSAACASAPAPHDRLANATTSVRVAQEMGATHVPNAELHLRLAQEQLDKGRKLMDEEENEKADLMLKRATADAELAIALSHEATSRDAAISAEQKAQQSSANVSPSMDNQAAAR